MSAVSNLKANVGEQPFSREILKSPTPPPSSRTGSTVFDAGGPVQEDDEVVGSAAGLHDVFERVAQVAKTDAPVLLEGETGSGKELIARTIHNQSQRAKGPMVRVNCGAIPAELIDSELFGHERGSFTGATATRQGWFERADGGTLFLDEVAELPLAAQVRLLRVLQEGTFTRVGGSKNLSVSVRVITATHRDLRAMCEAGTFRSDLWYRIGVFTVPIPPLRDRREDIPLLAAHFAKKSGIRLTGVPLVPSAAEIETLLAYPWPGNVRELAAVVERAAILGGGRRLEIGRAFGDAPAPRSSTVIAVANPTFATPATGPASHASNSAVESSSSSAASSEANGVLTSGNAAQQIETLDDAMRSHIARALSLTKGRIEGKGGAADLLGVNPHTLRGKMRRLKIDWARFRSVA
jgi:hydrogenase-4 transcriptional activator